MLTRRRNAKLLANLPTGFTCTATTQVAGRGRGSNVWVSPAGSLVFSVFMKHSMALNPTAPVVFIQYLAAIAIVEGIKSYDKGYRNIPVKLKWPNDICKFHGSFIAQGKSPANSTRRTRSFETWKERICQGWRNSRQFILLGWKLRSRRWNRPQYHQRSPNYIPQRSFASWSHTFHPGETSRPNLDEVRDHLQEFL